MSKGNDNESKHETTRVVINGDIEREVGTKGSKAIVQYNSMTVGTMSSHFNEILKIESIGQVLTSFNNDKFIFAFFCFAYFFFAAV